MGCLWSCESNEINQCVQCGRRAVNNLVIVDNVCKICIDKRRQRTAAAYVTSVTVHRPVSATHTAYKPKAYFGEYDCTCGRRWCSRLSWANKHQVCKRCNRKVHPKSQRELRPSDMSDLKDNSMEHPKELCQMCQQLGHYCGSFNKTNRPAHYRKMGIL